MPHLTEEQNAQVQAIEAMIADIEKSQASVDTKAAANYEPSAVSCSLTSGPAGANLQGWITYVSGVKVYFKNGKITKQEGFPIAMVGAVPPPLAVALSPYLLRGKRGTFIASGSGLTGTLQLYVDGKAVFLLPIPIEGAGIFGWRVEGEVDFEVHG